MLPLIFVFLSALQVGLLGFGGDTAPLALLEHETVTLHHWLTPAQFADLAVCCRLLPGGTLLGGGTMGACMATAEAGAWVTLAACAAALTGFAVPAAAWTAIAARASRHDTGAELLRCVESLLRPLVPGLVAAAAMLLMTADNFGSPSASPWQWGVSVFLFVSTLLGTAVFRINATVMVILCGFAGCVLL